MNNRIQSQLLVPLLGRSVAPHGHEQWIFPGLRFTCHGMLSKWIFKGEGSLESACRVHLTTWRLGIEQSYFSPVYKQVSTTNGNTAGVSIVNGSIFAYELARPVLVQPGDFVGVESASRTCANFYVFNNILSLNMSDGNSSQSSLSYMRSGTRRTTFHLESSMVYHKRDYLPLIYAVTGELILE